MDMTYTLDQLEEVAATLIKLHADKPVWAFFAPMGAGKTTLIGQMCKQLGVQDAVVVHRVSRMAMAWARAAPRSSCSTQ